MKFTFSLLPVYVLLLAVAIPWYWPAGDGTVVWPGLPAWALAAYLASGLTSLVTAIALGRLFAEPPSRETRANSDSPAARPDSGANRVD